jgi:hypothetical protein
MNGNDRIRARLEKLAMADHSRRRRRGKKRSRDCDKLLGNPLGQPILAFFQRFPRRTTTSAADYAADRRRDAPSPRPTRLAS